MKFFDAVHQFSIIGLTLGAADYLANLREEHIHSTYRFTIVDLASEHERYLVEDHFKRPVILTDYPKEMQGFLRFTKSLQVQLARLV